MVKLILIGYWHNLADSSLPDPGWFVDENWSPEIKQNVINYLKTGIKIPTNQSGLSWCRFRCGVSSLGSQEFTDGKYIWPEGLSHYVESHSVRLPSEIVDYFLANGDRNIITDLKNYTIDYDWWKHQKGWNQNIKTFKDIFDVGLITIKQLDTSQKIEQEKLILNFLEKGNGVRGKLQAVEKILNGQEVLIKGRFTDYADFSKKSKELGLVTNFKELTYEEYENTDYMPKI